MPIQTDKLNPALWHGDKLDPKIHKALLDIAAGFIEGVQLEGVAVSDIILTGSSANYNWSKSSDVDLHITIDMNKMRGDLDLVKDYLHDAAALWNSHHDIKMKGHPVEIYAQDTKEPHYSTGVYSLKDSKWLRTPKDVEDPPVKYVNLKAKTLRRQIEGFAAEAKNANQSLLTRIERFRARLREMRRSALEHGGEHAVENLAFKELRRDGSLDKLVKVARGIYDKLMSISEAKISLAELKACLDD